jgi:hypothetical protein
VAAQLLDVTLADRRRVADIAKRKAIIALCLAINAVYDALFNLWLQVNALIKNEELEQNTVRLGAFWVSFARFMYGNSGV